MTAASVEPATGDVLPDESDRLAALEQVIEEGLRTFLDVGRALAEIKDRHLYAVAYPDFASYARARWDLSAQSAFAKIYAASVGDAILTHGGTLPPGVAPNAMRELVPLLHREGAEAVADAWSTIQERQRSRGRPPSAGDVRAVLESSGLRTAAARGPRKQRIASIEEGLRVVATRIGRVQRELDGRPLPPAARERVAQQAQFARRIAAMLEELADSAAAAADLKRLERERREHGLFCVGHGRVRDERGVCTLCNVPDRSRADRPKAAV